MRGVAEQRNQDQTGGPGDDQAGTAPASPPRTMKAMLFAMLPLVAVAFLVAGVLGQCSFSPLGPTIDRDSGPTVDVAAELNGISARIDFPVFDPATPPDWRANSAATAQLGSGARAVRIGWITGSARYLRLSQSTAPEEELVAFEVERPPQAEGVVQAGGRQWVLYRGVRSEKVWVGERDGVRLLLTGSATEEEFRVLAEAVSRAPAR